MLFYLNILIQVKSCRWICVAFAKPVYYFTNISLMSYMGKVDFRLQTTVENLPVEYCALRDTYNSRFSLSVISFGQVSSNLTAKY